ncbi:MAG: hypothetical protein AAFQ68_19615, partial [Bacteroidota bacterium]
MKHIFLFFALWASMQSSWQLKAQIPETQRTRYTYDFATASYQLAYEQSFRYDEAGRPLFERYTSWQADRVFPNFLNEYYWQYHANGQFSSRTILRYTLDTLRSTYFVQYDERGNVLGDSSTYLNDNGEWEFNLSRITYTYDNQDRLREIDRQFRDFENPNWRQDYITTYTYDPNGCLTEVADGLERSVPQFRRRYEYGPNCQETAQYDERRQGFGGWEANRRILTSYETLGDSTKTTRRYEVFRTDSNRWVIDQILTENLDPAGRVLRSQADYANGAAGEELSRYNDQGDRIYIRNGYREFQTGQWIYFWEYEQLEVEPNRTLEVRRNLYDTTLQQYTAINYTEFRYEGDGRLNELISQDSTWNGNAYEYNERNIRYDAERYCDGLLRTEFITEGALGLSPQPTGKIEYGYAETPDCLSIDASSFQLHPNPATHIIMLESELLFDPTTKVQLVNLQ